MTVIRLCILGLLMSAAFAQDTGGGATGGVMTGGMSDESPTVSGTIEALEGGLDSLPVDQAVRNIEGWQARLEAAGDPALLAIAEQLEELKAALQTESADQTSAGLLLIEIGERTNAAAETAQGDEAAQLTSLGTLLSDAGSSLSEIAVEDVTVMGGAVSGGMSGGEMSGGTMSGGEMSGGAVSDGGAPSVEETLSLLEGDLTDVDMASASNNLERWRTALSGASDPELNTLADQLGELENALTAESMDREEVSGLLVSIGEGTVSAAEQAEGDQVAQLVDLGTLLINAGQLLSGDTGGSTSGGN